MPNSELSGALRRLPSVEELLENPALAAEIERYGHRLVANSARKVLEKLRRQILAGGALTAADLEPERLAALAREETAAIYKPTLQPLINATGVVVHTNLGRSIMAAEAIKAVAEVAASYSNLEYNLVKGTRGSRHDHITRIITALTGAESALVVNNNAAAVLLALTTFAAGREVVVSRGELIEIGGSFRIPDIMAAGSATLVEVGTTNKTRLADYEKNINPLTSVLLRVHTSNYKVVGFTAGVAIGELVELGRKNGLMVMDDLGSGALASLLALADEPSVSDSLASGADLITFSGDKLLGGPQAGIVIGKSEAVERMKAHPMARALRVDKMTLAALQATLALYLNPDEAAARIPTLRMLSETAASLKPRASQLAAGLKRSLGTGADVQLQQAASKVGGGALPLLELDSWVCAISPVSIPVDELASRLRDTAPPVIGRIHGGRLLLDVRTILPAQIKETVGALEQALGQN